MSPNAGSITPHILSGFRSEYLWPVVEPEAGTRFALDTIFPALRWNASYGLGYGSS